MMMSWSASTEAGPAGPPRPPPPIQTTTPQLAPPPHRGRLGDQSGGAAPTRFERGDDLSVELVGCPHKDVTRLLVGIAADVAGGRGEEDWPVAVRFGQSVGAVRTAVDDDDACAAVDELGNVVAHCRV